MKKHSSLMSWLVRYRSSIPLRGTYGARMGLLLPDLAVDFTALVLDLLGFQDTNCPPMVALRLYYKGMYEGTHLHRCATQIERNLVDPFRGCRLCLCVCLTATKVAVTSN